MAPFLPVLQPAQQPARPRPHNAPRNSNQSPLLPFALKEEYTEHIQAEAAFPPDIDNMNVHFSVLRYQFYMDSVIEGLKCVCGCCELFISEKESQIYSIDDGLICNSITSGLLTLSHVNSCAISDDNICLCLTCSRSLLLGNRPKFGILNGLLCVDCQSYPLALADLSMTEEAAIARAYPVVSILKLRPSGAFNLVVYSRIKGHAVLLL